MADGIKWGRRAVLEHTQAHCLDSYQVEPPQAAHAATAIGQDEHEAPGQLFIGVFWAAVFFAVCAAAALLMWTPT